MRIGNLLYYALKKQYSVLKPYMKNTSQPDYNKLFETLKFEIRLVRYIHNAGFKKLALFQADLAMKLSQCEAAARCYSKSFWKFLSFR